ncbi:MAG: ABC transporter substrate-binding protein [Saprospiraceae bacterium]|nr:ABC transporter substrate-binding protein [Saprospiraceae bacterium]
MILVQSLLRQSNGSKLVGVLLLIFLLSACGGTDKAVRNSGKTRTTKSASTKVTKVKKKVKEVEWKESKDDEKPPITNPPSDFESKPELIKEDVYDITYFIPFDANSYMNKDVASDRFVQYYSGMLVATQILEKEGVNLNINVVDEKKRKFENIIRDEVNRNTDVIVGPYSREALKVAAKFAKSREIPLISPWQASSKITSENPYYVQLRPSLDEHYYSIFEDIKEKYDLDQVQIIGRTTNVKDIKRLKKLQKMAKDVWGESDEDLLSESLLLQDSIDIGVTAFDSIFMDDKPLVVIVPNWSFEDESFIYGSLRRLSVEKGLSEVIVYGMPIMLESEKINFDYYSSLNMRVARSKFVDERDYDVARFKRDFVTKYGALPSDDAYEGYDNLMFIGRNLHAYGKNFQHYLNEDQGYYLQAAYKVEKTRIDNADDAPRSVDYFENKNVDIIEFKDNRFVRNME